MVGLWHNIYHLFGLMKEVLRGKHFACSDEARTAVMNWLKETSKEFYEAGIHALIRRWKIAI